MNIAILGSGTMGRQLILRNLISSHNVIAYTRDLELGQYKIHEYISKHFENSIAFDNLTVTNDLANLVNSDLIIECLPEDFKVKHDNLLMVNTLFPEIRIATCTSSITLKQLKIGMPHPKNLSLIHFSNPVSKAQIAEIQNWENPSSENHSFLENYLASINVKGIYVPDVPGFVLNRILFAMLFEALKVEAHSAISRSEIDTLMIQGCRMPMGPFEIIKFVGADTVRDILLNLYPESEKEIISFIL